MILLKHKIEAVEAENQKLKIKVSLLSDYIERNFGVGYKKIKKIH